jgi:hypothetical protein
MKSTILTNIYNEEYLLPMWLEHHKKIFDHGIIIDYWSTDNSVEICKKICPTWEIRTTKNESFGAIEIDKEFMEIENQLDGIKMILNTTEFLFVDKPLSDYFTKNEPESFAIEAYGPHSLETERPTTIKELIKECLRPDVKYIFEYMRGHRNLHSFPTGSYGLGRHSWHLPTTVIKDAVLLWTGYFPWNEDMIKRKLQIRTHIPNSDRERGYSYHHFWDLQTLENIRIDNWNKGYFLKDIQPNLFSMMKNYST